MDKININKEYLKKILIVFLAFVGFLTTIKLALIYYDANFNPYALASFCSVNEFIDCDGVAQTTHSQFFGIPLAYWGMFLYIFILFMVFVEKLKSIKYLGFLEVFKHPYSYIAALGFISFVISMILAGVSLFEIKKVCILCVFTYILNFLIALIATDYSNGFFKGVFCVFKDSVVDFFEAVKVRKYLISLLVVVILASGFLAYTSLSYVFIPQVKRFQSINEYAEMKQNPFAVSGNILGDKDAKFVVQSYSDYLCPICYTENIMLHRVAKELKGFKIVHHNLPLDMACNRFVKQPFHDGSCMLAKYSIAAEKQNAFWDINSIFFEKQPKNIEEVLKIAKKLNLDIEKLQSDANSKETDEAIQKDINQAVELGINGTPAMVINGKVYSGVSPYYELKEILINAGASERE